MVFSLLTMLGRNLGGRRKRMRQKGAGSGSFRAKSMGI